MFLRNPIGWRERLARARGTSVVFDLRPYEQALEAINALGVEIAALSDHEIVERAQALRELNQAGAAPHEVRVPFFALAREAAHRALGMRPFDVQMIAALAMDLGAVVEMQTGEGKTLAAVMPAALHALAGLGVHVLTVNDYLARRDAEWMRPVYSSVVEQHRRLLMERRRSLLGGDTVPDLWAQNPRRRDALVAAAGEDAVRRGEARITIGCIDRAWRDHLALAADLREGIHLVGLGGKDPLTEFTREMNQAFRRLEIDLDEAVLDALARVRVVGDTLDLEDVVVKGPSSTWTYLMNDDPFKNRIASMLSGPGRTTIGIASTIGAMPLVVVWGLLDWCKRRGARSKSTR